MKTTTLPARKPRLLHLTTIPATQWFLLRGQNQFMGRRGFELHAVSSPGDCLARLAARDQLTAHAVPVSRRIAPLADARSLARLYCLFRRIQPDIVHLSTPKAALLGALAAWAARVPVRLYHVRGLSSENERGWKKRVFALLERLTARLCHASICNARSLLEYARRERILRPAEGKVLANGMANGIDPDRFDPRKTRPADLRAFGLALDGPELSRYVVIGYVGRLTRDKGLEELAAAWTVLREEFPRTLLLLVGPHERECPVSAAARAALETDPRVVFTGVQEEVAPLYRAMQLAVFPSHGTEGFPNAPMEAAAMGLPVIVTRVVGSVEAVVDGVTGTVVSPKDATALTGAVRRYLRVPGLRARHGAAGRRRVLADFRPQAIWEALFEEYQRLLRERGRPLPLREVVEPARKRAAA